MIAASIQEFFQAIRSGDETAVASMLAADDALLRAKNEGGADPFTAAKFSRQERVAAVLLEEVSRRGIELDVFGSAVAGDETRVAQLLTADRTLASTYGPDGWTPLHLASFFGHPRVAKLLLEHGADVHARSRNALDNEPIHAAAAGRKADVIAVLLEYGADVNPRQHGGWTPLHAASQNGDGNLVRLLMAHGADRSLRAANNQSAMDLALTGGHQDVVDILDEYETGER
jgi:ankyrin repeat protein